MDYLQRVNDVFWSPSFWLPQNVTWEVFEKSESKDGLRMPSIQDVYFAWKLIPLVLFVKYFMEKCIAATFAKWLGVKEEPREKPPSVDILEREHRANPWGKWSHERILALSKELAWTEVQVRSWLKTRRRFALPTTAEKFSESSWRACVFFFIFTYGLSVHWSKEWLWDIKLCAQDYPQPVTDDIYWYFIISLANYSAWNFSHFWDVPRRDPKVVITHHFSAVVLLSGMWVAGAHRVGLLVCLTHDVGDILLEACKCSKYLNLLKAKAWWLWIFAFFNCGIWIFTRNIILPLHIIPSIYHYSPFNLPQTFPLSCLHGSCDISAFKFTMCHVLLIMLVGMSILHVYWTCIMVRISYLGLIVGKMEDDTRSMSNCDNDDDEDNHEKGIKLDRTNCPV